MRRLAIPLAALVATGGLVGLPAQPAAAAPEAEITDASFEWAINMVHQYAAPAGGCDYFVAGHSDGTPATYKTQDGDVYIVKRTADDDLKQASSANRCKPLGVNDTNGQRILFTGGDGIRSDDGVTIQWEGAATVNAYGGMVPWYIEDPELRLDADGNGKITAKVGGFASSMSNPDVKEPLEPIEGVTIADIAAARDTADGFTVTPVFEGVDYFPLNNATDPDSGRRATSAVPDDAKASNPDWGSWPESFVDFQYTTGLSSYWHTSGLSADPKKPPLPLSVDYDFEVPAFAPVFATAPESTTVSEGADVTFTASASGDPEPTIRWQRLEDGSWADIDGATGESYAIEDVTIDGHNGLTIRAVASSANGSEATDQATLTVVERVAPEITTQPADVEVLASRHAYFSVAATGSALTYRWQRSTDGGDTWADYGGTASQLQELGVMPEKDGHVFRVIVSNGVDDPITSDSATLTVTTEAPAITRQPDDLVEIAGNDVFLGFDATGAPYPDITWEHSTDDGKTWTTWATQANSPYPSLYLPAISSDLDGTLFRGSLDNGIGDPVVSEPLTVTVIKDEGRALVLSPGQVDPTTAGQVQVKGTGFTVPQDVPARAGLRIDLVERGTWIEDGPIDEPVASVQLDMSAIGPGGKIGQWLYFDALDPEKAYDVIVYRSDDTTDRRFDFVTPLQLAGQSAPVITAQPASATVRTGQEARFSVEADATPTPSYQWQALNPAGAWFDLEGETEATLTLPAEASVDGRAVRVVVANVLGETVSEPATLTVGTEPTVGKPANATVQQGQKATFAASVTATPAATLQWQLRAAGGSWRNVPGATGTSLEVIGTPDVHGNQYRVVATNGYGSATSGAATLTVTKVTAEPAVEVSVTEADEQGEHTITVTGTGFDPSLAIGSHPRAGEPSGVYVAFGRFAESWEPSKGRSGEWRPHSSRARAVLAEDLAAVGGSAVELSADGEFTVELTVSKERADELSESIADGRYGFYTYPAGDAWQPAYETYTPFSFVAKADGAVGLNVPAQLSFGAGGTVRITVAGVTDGEVELTIDGKEQTLTLEDGAASADLPATLAVGSHDVSVAFAGDDAVRAASATATVKVVKAKAKLTFGVRSAPTSKKAGVVRVRVASTAGVPTPSGRVRVFLTRKGQKDRASKVVSLKNGLGTITVPKAARGTWTVLATYSGSGTVAKVTRKKVGTLQVKK